MKQSLSVLIAFSKFKRHAQGVKGTNKTRDTQGDGFHHHTDEDISLSSEGSLILHWNSSSSQERQAVLRGIQEVFYIVKAICYMLRMYMDKSQPHSFEALV